MNLAYIQNNRKSDNTDQILNQNDQILNQNDQILITRKILTIKK